MKRILFLGVLVLAGCNASVPSDSGKPITACGGNHTDPMACGYADFNAPRLPNVKSGMTTQEVRAVMDHAAERRELDGNVETWYYMSDYQAEKMTAIVFTDGRVSGMKQVPWKTE